jgi:NitT/TauT family transport system ATP-binding protein
VPAKLAVERVSKRFFTGRSGEVYALDAVSLQVNVGGFLCLVGPSGCGKTTLLNIMAGLEKPDSGQVLADGKPITEPGPFLPCRFNVFSRSPCARTTFSVPYF